MSEMHQGYDYLMAGGKRDRKPGEADDFTVTRTVRVFARKFVKVH